MSSVKDLQSVAQNFTVLYVEDNKALLEKAQVLLKKFFTSVDIAYDGEAGLESFKEKRHHIVITDIKMPRMDGLSMSKHIHKINPQTKIIIMSAFDDKELLLKGIELGVFRFLTKPVNVKELTEVLYEAVLEIKHDQHVKMFYSYLKNIFNYQSSMVVMLHEKKIVLANDMFLEFFGFNCLPECKKSFDDISQRFLEHDGFLYNHDDVDAIKTIISIPQKLFHVKMQDEDGLFKHCILKYQDIPDKKGYGILSFDDVTELNLLELFDAKQNAKDQKITNVKAMYDLFEVIKRNSAKVELHNYYKGLSITNDAIITDIGKDKLLIKTSYMQLKAIQLEQKTYIRSSALPQVVYAGEVVKISFEKQEVELKMLSFVSSSPLQRATIRVVPSGKQNVSLFLGETKFHGECEIEDISLDAVRLKLSALPAGLEDEKEIVIDMVLELDKKPLIINTNARLFKKTESKHSFSVVFLFENLKKSALVKYITKRQMELIREIKGMQNG
jgi:YesN/AraC family two-component response regulator